MYLGFFITIHQGCTPRDTKSRYMHLGRVMMTLQDTIRIHHDTCILDASSEPRWIHIRIHTRYARGTLQIHLGYVSWTRSILSSMYPQHVSCMYLDYLRRYMYPACILHVFRMSPSYQIHLSLDEFEIHVHVHVSHYVSWMYPTCISITLADTCIPHVSRMYLASCII